MKLYTICVMKRIVVKVKAEDEVSAREQAGDDCRFIDDWTDARQEIVEVLDVTEVNDL